MDQQSYEDGKSGQASGPNTDTNSYRAGQAERDASTYKPEWETGEGGGKIASPESQFSISRPTVDGMTFVYIVLSPFLSILYPALGLTILGVFFASLKLAQLSPLPPGLEFLLALFPAIASFFWGAKLESKLTPLKPYRIVRWVIRMVFAYGFGAQLAVGKVEMENVSLEAVIGGVLAVVAAYFLYGYLDRIFFPVTYAPGSRGAKREQAREVRESRGSTLVSGKMSDLRKTGRKQWSFRVGGQPAVLRGRHDQLDFSNGDPVTIAGIPGGQFKVLAMLNEKNELLTWAGVPKFLLVLSSLVALVVALYIKPPLIGVVIIGVILALFVVRHFKKRSIEKAMMVLSELKLSNRARVLP
jgi:hypothetical protein